MNLSSDKLLQNEYRSRLNRTIDFIFNNYNEDLNLDILAKVACFSKFHFHRLFYAMTGETPKDFILRVRLENSVPMLTRHPAKSITEIALDCGFSCSQNYSKAFKACYGVTPSFVRTEFNWDELKMKLKDLEMKNVSEPNPSEVFFKHIFQKQHQLSIDNIVDKQQAPLIKLMKVPDLRVAYIRSKGPFSLDIIESAFQHLRHWAEYRELINKDTLFLSIHWNSPNFTQANKFIYDICITVPQSVKADRGVDIQTITGGKFAINHCQVELGHIAEAWVRFIFHLLMYSDYRPARRPHYQVWYSNPKQQSQILDLWVPIRSSYE